MLSAALLFFVAAGVVVLTVKSLRQSPPAATEEGSGDRIVAYYFHGKVRCPTCESIETYSKEAVETGFAEQLKDGRLEWRIVNYEEPGNEHYAADYNLAAPCVVLVVMHGREQVQWRGLPEVWEHVNDKASLIEFVQKNVREMLEANAPSGD
jgi:hypothetical protein